MSNRNANAAIAAMSLILQLAPGPAMATEPDWTRFYAGAQIGYSWDHLSVASIPPGIADGSVDTSSAIGGLQGGFNFVQTGTYVAGIVVDFNWLSAVAQGSGSTITTTEVDVCGDGCIEFVDTLTDTRVKLDVTWKSSVRGKVGILSTPTTLLYATGGLAFARIEGDGLVIVGGAPPVTTLSTDTATALGYVVGLGTETMVAPNMSAFVQVLYYGFNDTSLDLAGGRVNVDLDETIIETGLSFYFN